MLYTPDEIRRIFDEYQRRRALNIPITEDFARQLQDAAVGVKNYTFELENNLNQLKSAGSGLFDSMLSGRQGASVFNDILTSGADVVATLTKRMGPLGTVLGTLTKFSIAYVTAANEQSDALFDSYTELTKFGAGFDTGLDGVFRVNQQLGYSIRELGKFSGLVNQNRKVFPMFRGTVTQGVKAFGDVTDSLRGYEYEFRMLGMSIDDVNTSVANYLHIQTMTGMTQNKSLSQLSEGAYNYIRQQRLVTQLTGQNAEAQRAAEEQMANNVVFQITQRQLRIRHQQALANQDTAEAARLEAQINQNRKLIALAPEAARKGLMEVQGGFVGASREAEQAFMLMPEATRMAMAQRYSAVETLDKASKEATARLDQMGNTLGKLGLFEDIYGSMVAARELELMGDRQTVAARQQQAENETEALKQLKGATSDYAKMLMEQRRTREAAEDFVNAGVNPTTAAMKKFAEAARATSGVLAKTAGVPPGTPPAAPAAAAPAAAPTARTPRRAGAGAGVSAAVPVAAGSMQQQIRGYLAQQGITDPVAVANILAQIQAESGFVPRSENLNYSGSKLFELYGPNQSRNRVRFRTLEEANALAAQGPEAVGNVIYGGRMGNAADEGFKYRGRGLIQLTGKDNYRRFGEMISVDLVSNPDRANDPDIALKIAAAYFAQKTRGGVDLTDIAAVGRAVGYAGGDRETARRAEMAESFLMAQAPVSGYRFGGVAADPDASYMVELHGDEAVVPLPDGRSIPVEMPNYSAGLKLQTEVMSEQSKQLSELITIMRTRNQISEKILRAYQT